MSTSTERKESKVIKKAKDLLLTQNFLVSPLQAIAAHKEEFFLAGYIPYAGDNCLVHVYDVQKQNDDPTLDASKVPPAKSMLTLDPNRKTRLGRMLRYFHVVNAQGKHFSAKSIAVDEKNLYIGTWGLNRDDPNRHEGVVVCDKITGNFLFMTPKEYNHNPFGVAVDDKYIYSTGKDIHVFDKQNGNFVYGIPTFTQFDFDHYMRIYTGRRATKEEDKEFTELQRANGEFNRPKEIAVDEKHVYIADQTRVQVFDKCYDKDGKFYLEFKAKLDLSVLLGDRMRGHSYGESITPESLAVDDENIYVTACLIPYILVIKKNDYTVQECWELDQYSFRIAAANKLLYAQIWTSIDTYKTRN